MRRLLALVGLGLVLVGCSQAAAIAPVGGNRLTLVRFAALDVLVANGVALLDAPVCTQSGKDVTCSGDTVDHQPVVVASPDSDRTNMTVTVGGSVVYSGSVQDILDKAARPTS
jgi:hypothetical protein